MYSNLTKLIKNNISINLQTFYFLGKFLIFCIKFDFQNIKFYTYLKDFF